MKEVYFDEKICITIVKPDKILSCNFIDANLLGK